MPNKSILIVEDDEDLGILISQGLKMGGYDSKVATDGVQAMMLARQMQPALVILDYMFPAGGGAAFHQRLRLLAQTRQTPIILLSATPQNIVIQGVRMDSCTYFLAKPYKKDQLLELIRQILQENMGASGS